MFTSIMVPVDLLHADKIAKAIQLAADLGKRYGASAHLVSVTVSQPSEVAHNPEEFAEKLAQFAAARSAEYDFPFQSHAVTSHDPAVDIGDALRGAFDEIGADLVIMASHAPGFLDHFFTSRAGALATHSDISVFVVR